MLSVVHARAPALVSGGRQPRRARLPAARSLRLRPARVSIHGGRRQALSRLLRTRLMTVDEFRSLLTRHKHRGKNHGEAGG